MKLHIHISEHKTRGIKSSGKMDGLSSINVNPLSNPYCKAMNSCKDNVCHYCYSIYQLHTFRKGCVKPWENNSLTLSSRVLLDSEIPYINRSIVRYNSHGELINDNHFLNLCSIARLNSQTHFTLFTKRKEIVAKYIKRIPNNMMLVYSSPKVNRAASIPKGFNKVFTVYTMDYKENHGITINCIGHCRVCRKCYDFTNKDKAIRELIRLKGAHMNTIRHRLNFNIRREACI